MAKHEHTRDLMRGPITSDYLELRLQGGWRPVAVEWEREVEGGQARSERLREEVPFGLRVAGDCLHLEENPAEMEILTSMMELMIQDISLARVAEELNRKGFPTREGGTWTAANVFRLLPRLIDVAPNIFTGQQWEVRRKRLAPVLWNS
ncbi:MAG TPA: recombinase family protein [Candidatus Acidoferrales bacterium]|nr:recombinase family protein [Candidatus Acidoferrales bacterium]